MKNFFTSFFGAIVGVIIALVLCTLIFVASIVNGVKEVFKNDSKAETKLKPKSVLYMDFKAPIADRTSDNPFANFNFSSLGEEALGLDKIVERINLAKEDTAIKGIYMNLTELNAGVATVEEIRNTLLDFKGSKKFIYAYSEMYSQKSYYLASVADKLYMNPQGMMEFKGLSAQIMFYKKALENLNVDVQIFRHGKFKSAIEPFMLDKMSEANRLQTEVFMGSIWNSMLDGVSKQRGISKDELNSIADELKLKTQQDAVTLKLVDALLYRDEVMTEIRKKIGIEESKTINFVKLVDYKDKDDKEDTKAKNKIAVIYAVGSIESGEGDDNTIGSDRIAKAIRQAREDSTVKAIVLRVNSPGGSALASDVMWREVTLAKKAKPFIVSMGDVAASGGYYISCAADKIYAQPNTITGSIGVFGMMPNAQKLLSQKLGINVDTVNTNKHSDIGTIYRPVTETERVYIQKGVEDVYDVFTKRVAEGRKMTQAEVDSIGQGRVWAGSDALKIKLVDELGGLDQAIAYAVKVAKLDKYSKVTYPKRKNALDEILGKAEDKAEEKIMTKNLGETYKYLKYLQNLLRMKGVQARLPFEYVIY
ncbi:MAG: signal peptide peptidase SppA, type [Bacteroidetes bacterium]|jgi:protease-4|nr:signal peptide peptidase SppA, type [Bacteroidota bacterium]